MDHIGGIDLQQFFYCVYIVYDLTTLPMDAPVDTTGGRGVDHGYKPA